MTDLGRWQSPMAFLDDLRGAYRRVLAGPSSLTPDEAAQARVDVTPLMPGLLRRYRGRRLWRALYRTLWRDVLAYCAAAMVFVAVSPLVPWQLDRTLAALDRGGSARQPAVALSVAVLVVGVAGWASTWRVRRLVGLTELCVQRLLFRRLQRLDPRWLNRRDGSTLAYLLTYPQMLSQIAFVAQFCAYLAQVTVLTIVALVWFGPLTLSVLVAVAGVGLLSRWLIRLASRRSQEYLDHDHGRTRLVEVLASRWQPLRRQYLEGEFLAALTRVRDGQRRVVRRRGKGTAAAPTAEDSPS